MSQVTIEQVRERLTHLESLNARGVGIKVSSQQFEIACLRKLLASLEAEPVGEVVLGEYDDCGCHPDARVVCIAADGQADWGNFKDGTRLYAAPPSLVVIDEREAFNAWNNDENLPIAGVGAKNAAWLAWQARAKLITPPAPVVPAELHPDTQKLVIDFCTALAEKLYKAQLKYGYDADWKQDGWPTQCQAHFHQHISKGDPRDVAAYCAFMWYHGWKTEPAPVSVPDFKKLARELVENLVDCDGADDSAVKQYLKWTEKTCRDAMLQGANQAPVKQPSSNEALPESYYPETLPCPVLLEPGLRFGKGVPTRAMIGALQRRSEYYAELDAMTPEQRAEHDTGMKEFAAMLQGGKS